MAVKSILARCSLSGKRPNDDHYIIDRKYRRFAAPFTSGPVEEIVNIGSEQELAEIFGRPNDLTMSIGLLQHSILHTAVYSEDSSCYIH